jgi:hypothetical protein
MKRHIVVLILRDIVIMMLRPCHHAVERHNVIVTAHVELYFFQILVACQYIMDCFIQLRIIVMTI